MQTTANETLVTIKTRELCQALIEEPAMKSIRQRIDTFMKDEKTRTDYENLVGKGQALQQKQQSSLPLSSQEIASFESERDAFLANPVARGFLDAQEELQQVRDLIQKHITRTLELGRVPTEEDLHTCCEHGCGGHGH